MIYFDLNTRLHPTQAGALLNLEHSFWDHQTHGDDTNLDIALLEDESLNGEIRSMFQVEPTVVTMMRIQAGKEVVPHVDNPEHRRLSSVVFPLETMVVKNMPHAQSTWMKAHMISGDVLILCHFNTQIKHGVKNDTESMIVSIYRYGLIYC